MKKELFPNFRRRATFPDEASQAEMAAFLRLQAMGLDARTSLELSFDKHELIIDRLEGGKSLASALSVIPGWSLLEGLCEKMDLDQAVDVIDEMGRAGRKLTNKSAASMIYPTFILLAVFGLLVFFRRYVLPSMGEFLEGDTLTVTMVLLELVLGIFLVALLLYGVMLWLGMKGKINTRHHFVVRYRTLQFTGLVAGCVRARLPALEMMELLCRLDTDCLMKSLLERLRLSLMAGNELSQAVMREAAIDPDIAPYFSLGLAQGELSKMLEVYQKRTLSRLEQSLKKRLRQLSLASYVSVGVLAVHVYQVLLAPMNILNSM